jgi:hypothetical protein
LSNKFISQPDERGAPDPSANEQHMIYAFAWLKATAKWAHDADSIARITMGKPISTSANHVKK